MWKYLSGVSKVVDEKKNEKAPKASCDMREYEKTRSRKFSMKWQVGRPCLKYDEEKGMICRIHSATLRATRGYMVATFCATLRKIFDEFM